MKKTNSTNPRLVNNWMMIIALIFTAFSFTQLNAQCQLNVEDEVNISVNSDCEAKLTKKLFLTDDGMACQAGQGANNGYYEFEVRSLDGLDIIYPQGRPLWVDETKLDYGQLYMAIIVAYDVNGDVLNTGMSTFSINDKMPPTIDCPVDSVEIACWQEELFFIPVHDNCSDVNLIWTDEVVTTNDCSVGQDGLNWPTNRLKEIDRTYVAVDASGNQSLPCEVTLRINLLTDHVFYDRFPRGDAWIQMVPNLESSIGTAISCVDADNYKDAEGNFDPNKTGWPTLIHLDPNPTAAELAVLPVADLYDTIRLDNNCTLGCNLAATYIDIEVNTCPKCVEKVLRMWTVVETSCQHPERFRLDAQHIEIYDDIDPIIVCPDDITITTNTIGNFAPTSAGDLDCGAMFTFPVPEMSDDCQGIDLPWTISVMNDMGHPVMFADTAETRSPVTRALPFGINEIEYIVYDNCGNSAVCTWYINVFDSTPPVAICQQFTAVSLTYDGEAEIAAHNFDSGTYDDCTIDRFEVRRMDGKIFCGQDTTDELFRPWVRFCCDDIINNDITVIMRAYDKSGSYNDCMVQVNVQDKLPPQITCPPSICVECEYPFVITEMENTFGTVVDGYEFRETHTILGDFGSLYFVYDSVCGNEQSNFRFKDGWTLDNCGLEIQDTFIDYRNQCGEGNIVRTFTASDPNGTVDCYQTVHFYNPDPFNYTDITWPRDTTLEGCTNEALFGPDITGWPILVEDNCDLVAANYNDLVFHFNDDNFDAESVCFKIIRRWTVMDWCQKYPEDHHDRTLAGTYYTWQWDQVIMISEFDDPTFTSDCEDKETCTYDTECLDGYIELTMSAEDECTELENLKWRYQIDYDNNGHFDVDSKYFVNPIISGSTANASGDYPIGKHRIVWTVWDQCGNKAICDKFFTIKNCKQPTPICIDHINIEMMPVDLDSNGISDWAMIAVDAQLVEKCCPKSYHVCGYPLLYSFSADTNYVRDTFDCDDIGLQEIQMWVTALMPDGSITQDYCVTHIDFQDNNHACPDSPDGFVNVSGMVTTLNDDPIANTTVELQGSEMTPKNTNDNGTFAFVTSLNKNYILAPSKDSDPLNGVTTLDLVIIQKHLLGLKSIDNPYMLLAANAKIDESVSAADILVLRKLILGSTNTMDETWMFIEKDYEFENSNQPFNETIPTEVAINTSDDVNIDFYGIKIGDVNNSLDVLELRSSDKLILATDAMDITPGSIEIPVYAENFNNTQGFQYTISFDASIMIYEGVESGELMINNSNVGISKLEKGILSMSWNTVSTSKVNSTEPLFTLKFNVVSNAKLQNVMSMNSSLTRKEAYNAQLEVMDVELEFRNTDNTEFALYQNTPNPFSVHTDINFNLPKGSNGTIGIYDLSGRVIKVIDGVYEKGMNTVRIKKSDLNVSGVLYYRLETEGYTATKKMILIK